MAAAVISVAPEMKRQSPALVAAAAEERVEEEEGDCNSKLEGTLADDCDAAAGELPKDAATNGFEDKIPNGLEEKGNKLADDDVGTTLADDCDAAAVKAL